MIIDAQLHGYAAHCSAWPWANPAQQRTPLEITGDEMIALMDAAGVDGTIMVSPWLVYREDTRYAESVYRENPDRFRLVAPIDPNNASVAQRVHEWAGTPGAVGFRLLFRADRPLGTEHPGVIATVKGAADVGLPVNVHCWGCLAVMDELARAFPDAQLVLDHLGLPQPHDPPAPAGVLGDLDQVLALARYPNVAVKVTGACTYSRRPFPYDDLWQPIGRVLDAFGVERCMWGTDWHRTAKFLTYQQALSAFRDYWPLSGADRNMLLGGTAMRIYDWEKFSGPRSAA